MKRISPAWTAILIVLALCGMEACLEGSETGNPAKGTTGILKTLDGIPAANARVYLLPQDFNPLDLVAKKTKLATATTDRYGRFRLTVIDSGIYNLEALDLKSGARAFIKGLAITKGVVELPEQTLKYPGRIEASLEGAADTVNGYIYVTGTTLYKKVSAVNGKVSLDSVPGGIIDSLQYGNPERTVAPRPFAWNLEVAPEAVTMVAAPYLAWKRTRTIILNTTGAGAGVAGTVTRIPLLVRLSQANFDFSAAANGGLDLRFTNGRGGPLPCEIGHWDASANAAEAWVLVDTVFGDSMQKLHMYWGGNTAAPLQSGAVFDVADGYAGVWHLDEDPTGAAPQLQDVSGRNNPATAIGFSSPVGTAPGTVDGGLALDGKTQFAATRKSFVNPQVFTLSGWFRTSTTVGGKLLDFTDADTSITTLYRDRHIFMSTNGIIHFSVYPPIAANQADPNPGVYKTIDSPKPLNDGQWHQIAARLSPGGQALFVDGTPVASDPASTVAENITGYWRWGYGGLDNWTVPGTSRYFQGTLDEIWIVHSARSDDFIKLNFENLKTDSRLFQFP